MPLLINKEGKQLGPYTVEEARGLVLSGHLTADDLAWPDGATKWIPLKDVAGFAPPGPLAGNPPTPGSATAEEELWRGHPSQMLNFKAYLITAAIVLLMLGLTPLTAAAGSGAQGALILALGVFCLGAFLYAVISYFRLRAIEYVVTTQRVRVISGLFSKDIQEIELMRVKDTQAHQSFFMRLFGLGTITILSGDERNPRLVLSGIPKAIELRERMRQEVMTLRQRFGVRELDVM